MVQIHLLKTTACDCGSILFTIGLKTLRETRSALTRIARMLFRVIKNSRQTFVGAEYV